MKILLTFVGTMCLMGATHSESITSTVSNAVSISEANLASTIQRVNGTIVAADQSILDAWNSWGNSMVELYNSYYIQFKDYTSVDLSPITSAISDMQSTMTMKPMLMQEDTYHVQQIFSDVQMSAQQVGSVLNAAAENMTAACGTTCTNPKYATCVTKFGGKLSTAPLTINRVSSCIAAEETRFLDISSIVTSQYTNALTSAMNYLLLVNICDIPAPQVLNNPPMASGSVSTQCFTSYLQRFSNMPNYYSADTIRMIQMQVVSFRAKRCANLVQLDIQDRVNVLLANFSKCLG